MNSNQWRNYNNSIRLYPRGDLAMLALGLTGEAGEVADKIKKYYRDGKLDKSSLRLELGDCLWYLDQIARDLDCTIEDIMLLNHNKLKSRNERGTIQGEGDYR